jgi:mannose-1-phosphate guanylyltransferase
MKTKEIILSDQGGNYIVPAKGKDAIPVVYVSALTLTNTEHNVLMVALDHMYEHLNDLVGDLDTFEEENINLKRIVDVQSLKEMFNL